METFLIIPHHPSVVDDVPLAGDDVVDVVVDVVVDDSVIDVEVTRSVTLFLHTNSESQIGTSQ